MVKKATISYRFLENNLIRKTSSSIVTTLLVIPICMAFCLIGDNIYGSFFIFVRALSVMYFNYENL
jgi:hypothetical protein